MKNIPIIILLCTSFAYQAVSQIIDLGETQGLVLPIIDTIDVDNPSPGQMVLMPTAYPPDSLCPPHCGYTMLTFNGETWFDMSKVRGLFLEEWALSDDTENGLQIKHSASGFRGMQMIPGIGDTMSVVMGGPGNSVFDEEESSSFKSGLFGAPGATVGGGTDNRATSRNATVSGGYANRATDFYTTIGGGGQNKTTRRGATVGGGENNEAMQRFTTISGGVQNEVTGRYATISGGFNNLVTAEGATISGGENNEATGRYATVPGGLVNKANGTLSFASGYRAEARHDHAFVWSGANRAIGNPFASTDTSQFIIYAPQGVGIGTNAPTNQLTVLGTIEIDGTNNGIKFPDGTEQKTAAITNGWSLTGNAGTAGTGILGTTDGFPFSIHTNNQRTFLLIPPVLNTDAPTIIGGYKDNEVLAQGGTISGGGSADGKNSIIGNYGTIGGGLDNRASLRSVVGGGETNVADGQDATISGGNTNTASSNYSSVGGGLHNSAFGLSAVISGGQENEAWQQNSTVGGGADNETNGVNATIAGGKNNKALGLNSTVSGGSQNVAIGEGAVVPGGVGNKAEGPFSLAAGTRSVARHNNSFVWNDGSGSSNDSLITTQSAQFLVRALGGTNITTDTLCVDGMLKVDVVGNGIVFPDGTVQTTASMGGSSGWSFSGDAINPGEFLGTTNNEPLEFLVNNIKGLRLLPSLTMGETPNVIAGDAANNIINVGSYGASISGGSQNMADTLASVGGGEFNHAQGKGSTIGGGNGNFAIGNYSMIPGGVNNRAEGENSFAAGSIAEALHDGSFVWQDASMPGLALQSSASNQFIAKAAGGTTFYSDAGGATGVTLAPGSGSWTSASSVHLKTDFDAVNGVDILDKLNQLEIRKWRYKAEAADISHIGPTSQDFKNAFGLGSTDEGISTVDADGVAMAAIKELYHLVKKQAREIEKLQSIIEHKN